MEQIRFDKQVLRRDFEELLEHVHELGMRFYSAENRLRSMGDDLCCCGIDGLGWKTNTGNLVHMLFDSDNVHFSEAQKKEPVGQIAANINQDTLSREYGKQITFERFMKDAFKTKSKLLPLIGE